MARHDDRSGGPTFVGGLMALARVAELFYRPVPLEEFPVLRLAPESSHKDDGGKRGGNFAIEPEYIQKKGGVILQNAEKECYGLFVDEEMKSLAIDRLHARLVGGQPVLHTQPEKSPVKVSLLEADNKRYPVGKDLRLVVVFKETGERDRPTPAVHFYNKSQKPMDVALFRANRDETIQSEPATSPAGAGDSRPEHPAARLWKMARVVTSRFNSTIIFFGLAAMMVLTAVLWRHFYVRQFIQEVRGEPYAVALDRQNFGVKFQDSTASHALRSKELSYPIYQSMTFLGRGHSSTLDSITVTDVTPALADAYQVRVALQGGESKVFRVNVKDASGMKEMQDFIFQGNFEQAQRDAVAVPDILTTFFMVMFLAAGLFFIWGVWRLWEKAREISVGATIRQLASPHKIIGGLDAEAQRNIAESLGPTRQERGILGEVEENIARKERAEAAAKERRGNRGEG